MLAGPVAEARRRLGHQPTVVAPPRPVRPPLPDAPHRVGPENVVDEALPIRPGVVAVVTVERFPLPLVLSVAPLIEAASALVLAAPGDGAVQMAPQLVGPEVGLALAGAGGVDGPAAVVADHCVHRLASEFQGFEWME